MQFTFEQYQQSADYLRSQIGTFTPKVLLILGSGLGYLANEVELKSGAKKLRCDSVLYDTSLRPRMIIEYKAPTIELKQSVFDQISTYNLLLHVDYLIVSNGMQHYCCKMDYDNQRYLFLPDIPEYSNL